MFDEAFAALAALILVAGPLAVGVTKVTDLIRNLFDSVNRLPHWVWNAVPMGLGVLLAFGWSVNLASAVVAAVPALSDADITGTVGEGITGVVIGGMASFWHEKLDQWSAWAKGRGVTR